MCVFNDKIFSAPAWWYTLGQAEDMLKLLMLFMDCAFVRYCNKTSPTNFSISVYAGFWRDLAPNAMEVDV